jgi:NADPH:quinone reductase
MKAWIVEHFNNPEVFKQTNIASPKVLPHQVLIRVKATSVNPVDCKIRQGAVPDISPELPAILHGDVAGVIEAVGEGVKNWKVGDEVYGCAGGIKGMGGALAEFMLADPNLIARKPKSLSMREAAALPLVSITAWEGLRDRVLIQSGQTILVHGGTGGVGHVAVQLAKLAGAKVFATVSSDEKAQLAKTLGADFTIDYRKQPVEEYVAEYTNGEGFDIVFDTVGNDNLQNAFKAAKLNGTVISIVSLSSQDLTLLHTKGLTLHLIYMLIPMLFEVGRERHGQILADLAKLVDEGKLRPLLDPKQFIFAEVAEAHRHAESGNAVGKVTIAL